MAKSLHLHRLLCLSRPMAAAYTSQMPTYLRVFPHSNLNCSRLYFTATPCPHQYEMIVSRPVNPPSPSRRRPPPPNSQSGSNSDMGFDEWLDKKLSSKDSESKEVVMDKSKRKYYNKRRKRMYGESDSDGEDGRGAGDNELVELKQEVVEPRTMFHREQELYFYDTFAYPWEKNKHYRMVYQLEKKFFPGQGFDRAFLQPGESNDVETKGDDDRGIVFFDEDEKEVKEEKDVNLKEKKVEDFFKGLKKTPNSKYGEITAAAGGVSEPVLSTRTIGLPEKWDGPNGTVVLVNKPKGECFHHVSIAFYDFLAVMCSFVNCDDNIQFRINLD